MIKNLFALFSTLSLLVVSSSPAFSEPWLIRTSDTVIEDNHHQHIYTFLNGDRLLATSQPADLFAAQPLDIYYLEPAAKLDTGDRTPSLLGDQSYQDYLSIHKFDDLSLTQRQCDSIRIAVIDSGVDSSHSGWGNTVFTQPWNTITETENVEDGYGHGTHITGIISSSYLYGQKSIEGVCSSATIIPIKFLSDFGDGTIANSIEAINWAIESDAQIINHSWTTRSDSIALRDVISDANQRGILQISAAGNSGTNNDTSKLYPANYSSSHENMIAVANWDEEIERLNASSNYGFTHVDIAATGTNILSLSPDESAETLSGTSMSAPIVAGAAAMIMQQTPSLSAAQTRSLIQQTASYHSALEGKVSSSGKLDILAAMEAISINPDIVSIEDEGGQYRLKGNNLQNIDQWYFQPAIPQSEQIPLSIISQENTQVELDFKRLPSGYFRGLTQNEMVISYPYISESIAPSELAIAQYSNKHIIQWKGNIWAESYDIQLALNGSSFKTISNVKTPFNQYSHTVSTDSRHRYRVRARYDYNFNNQPTTTILSAFSPEASVGLINLAIQAQGFASAPVGSSAIYVISESREGNSIQFVEVVEDTGNKVINFDGQQIALDTQQSGKWEIVFRTNLHEHYSFTFEVNDSLHWKLSSASGAKYIFYKDNAEIQGITELDGQEIIIFLNPSASTSLLSIQLEGDDFNLINSSVVSDDDSRLSITNQNDRQANILINGDAPLTLRVTPQVERSQLSASSDEDTRCFLATSIYPTEPNKLEYLRNFRDSTLAHLPGANG